jgi:hypothetical protein
VLNSGKGPRTYPQYVENIGQVPEVTRRLSEKSKKHNKHRKFERRPLSRLTLSTNASQANIRLNHPQLDLNATDAAADMIRHTSANELVESWNGPVDQRRRRLGMSGQAVWPIWRGDAAIWINYFFGGLPLVSVLFWLRITPPLLAMTNSRVYVLLLW